jgi:hypothetical protein
MQVLSRVSSSARVTVGLADTMPKRPALAAKVAQCISEFSNIETMLPVLLAFMLKSDPKTALAMFGSLENRAAQLRLLNAAAEQVLDEDRFDCWTVLQAKFIKRCMKERDRFAHWAWGYSPDFPAKNSSDRSQEGLRFHVWRLRSGHRSAKRYSRLIGGVPEMRLART